MVGRNGAGIYWITAPRLTPPGLSARFNAHRPMARTKLSASAMFGSDDEDSEDASML
jgi:hypothetical protein